MSFSRRFEKAANLLKKNNVHRLALQGSTRFFCQANEVGFAGKNKPTMDASFNVLVHPL
jgi:hypothetical protein